MAKQLSMGQKNSIIALHHSGHSNRKIAELLGVSRETVAKYVAQAAQSVTDPAKPERRVRPKGEERGDLSVTSAFPTNFVWPSAINPIHPVETIRKTPLVNH